MYAKPLLLWKKIKKIQKNLKTRKQMSAILSGEIVSVYKRKACAFRFSLRFRLFLLVLLQEVPL